MKKQLRLLLILFFASVTWLEASHIEEFHSTIEVATDGTLRVTDRISFVVDDSSIRHGLYRDFPIDYTTPAGMVKRIGFDVIETTLDGQKTPHTVSRVDQYTRVKMGRSDRQLRYGMHTLTLTYKTNQQIGFFENHDELYWNVTGMWGFPIRKATAAVILPRKASEVVLRQETYTGFYGSRTTRATGRVEDEKVLFECNDLASNEGLTIVVGWKKGVVEPPTWMETLQHFPALVIMAIASLGIWLFYRMVLQTIRRKLGPPKSVFPRFEPPEGVGPGEMRYVLNMGYDDDVLTTAVVNLAAMGYLTIDRSGKHWKLIKTNAGNKASASERLLFNALFEDEDSIKLSSACRDRLKSAVEAYQATLATTFGEGYFVFNHGSVVIGALLTVSAIYASFFFVDLGHVLGAFISIAVSLALLAMLNIWGGLDLSLESALPCCAAGFAAGLMFLGITPQGIEVSDICYMAFCNVLFVINLRYYYLLRVFTPKGAEFKGYVDGLKMFLSATHEDRLAMEAQGQTIEQFERLLPYALALGVAHPWTEQFRRVFDERNYHPVWLADLSGHHRFSASQAGDLRSSLNSAFAQTVAPPPAQQVPGSTSGFSRGGSSGRSGGGGGGGYSGGGGGGGRGGGW